MKHVGTSLESSACFIIKRYHYKANCANCWVCGLGTPLIVGGITGFVSIVLFGLLFIYMRHLNNALNTIRALESILPICSNCKKIRKTDSDPKQMNSWQPIESYISQKTTTKFSHGICPECLSKLYPEYTDIKMKQNDVT